MKKPPKAVREPVQVYLSRDEKALLNRLSEETGVSRAEILRRGLREFGLRHSGESPMLVYLRRQEQTEWTAVLSGDGAEDALAAEYRVDPSGEPDKSDAGE